MNLLNIFPSLFILSAALIFVLPIVNFIGDDMDHSYPTPEESAARLDRWLFVFAVFVISLTMILIFKIPV